MIRETNRAQQTSAELRYASNPDQPVRYVIGGYVYDDHTSGDAIYDAQTAGADSVQTVRLSDLTYAFFGQATWALTHSFRLTGGLRYTYDQKSTNSLEQLDTYFTPQNRPLVPSTSVPLLTFPTVGAQSWDDVTWKAGFEYDVAPRSLLYGNVSTGFKAGGFFYDPAPNTKDTYNPEKVTAYTLGLKNRFLDNRLQVNLEAFDLEYTNQQIATLLFAQFGPAAWASTSEQAPRSIARMAEVDSRRAPSSPISERERPSSR